MKYSQPLLILVILIASVFSLRQVLDEKNEQEKETAMLLDVYVSRLSDIIDGTILVTEILKELIILHNGNPPLDEVIRLCSVLFDEEVHINLSYAPNGVIEYSYPVAGNEAAIGHRLLEDPNVRDDAIRAKETGVPTLSKPYALKQGGVAAVVRDPVFIEKDGILEFWGFAAIAMHTSNGLIIHSDISSLEMFNYEYRLTYYHNDEPAEILVSEGFNLDEEYITKAFRTKYGIWELSLLYNTSHSENIQNIIVATMFYIAIVCGILYIGYHFIKFILRKKNNKN